MKKTTSILIVLLLLACAAPATVIRVYLRDYTMRYAPALTLHDPRGGNDSVIYCDTWQGLAQIYAWYFSNVLNGGRR